MKHSILFTTLFALLAGGILESSAVPAYPKPVRVTQSDGTQITIRTYGDEYHHYTLSDEGYTLTGGPGGDYYYATLAADGTLVPTSVKAKPVAKLDKAERAEISKIQKGIKPTAASPLKQLMEMRAARAAASHAAKASVGGNNAPGRITTTVTTGKRKWPIILVQFSDIKFTVTNPSTAISNLLNQKGYSVNGSTGSAWDYYHENSDGQFDPEFVVYGPYTASKSASYYAGNSGTARVAELLIEVCKLADKDINFADYNAGGVIQDVILFYAGYNQAEGASNTIWPHCSSVGYRGEYFDGVLLDGYGCFSELRMDEYGNKNGDIANIGTFCHEFGHIMGWPDFYDTDYSGAAGTESFSLMCSGSYNNESRTPPALNILERWMMGWAAPEELTTSGYYSLAPVTDSKGYLISSNTTNEYFLAEYRGAGENKWDNPSYIGGSGLMVYHVDNTPAYNQQWTYYASPNDDPKHECMKLVRSVPGSKDNPMRTFFPGSNNVTALSAARNSLYKSWNGQAPFVELEDIAISGNTVTMTVLGEGSLRPDLKFRSTVYQYSALLTWTDAASESWEVSWNAKGSPARQSRVVRQTEIYVEGLTPATDYEVTITPTPGGSEKAQTYTFTTAPRSEGQLRIVLPTSDLTNSIPVSLAIADYPGAYKQIEWYIDDTLNTSGHLTFKTGEHRITAVITAEDGTKEYLIKYITVK